MPQNAAPTLACLVLAVLCPLSDRVPPVVVRDVSPSHSRSPLLSFLVMVSIRDVGHSSSQLGMCVCKFFRCWFGDCPGPCTICHSWQRTGVVHLSLPADGKAVVEVIPAFGVCRPACHDSLLYLFFLVLFRDAVAEMVPK